MMTVVTERADLNWAPALFFAVNGCLTVSAEKSSLDSSSRMGRYANGSNTILSMVLFLCTANLCLKIHTRAQLGSIWTGEPSAQILAS
jgi:hypothetical protein